VLIGEERKKGQAWGLNARGNDADSIDHIGSVRMLNCGFRPNAVFCPSPCDKLTRRENFGFSETPNQVLNCGHPVPARGAVARRHERGMGCGGRESVGMHCGHRAG
jgi:hypothetical protein